MKLWMNQVDDDVMVAFPQRVLDTLPSHQLPDVCASIVKGSYHEKSEILNAVDLQDRFAKTLPLLVRQIEVITDEALSLSLLYSRFRIWIQ